MARIRFASGQELLARTPGSRNCQQYLRPEFLAAAMVALSVMVVSFSHSQISYRIIHRQIIKSQYTNRMAMM